MTPSDTFHRLTYWNHGESDKEDNERTAQLTMEILEDLRLTDSVERALCATGHGPLRSVDVSVNAGIVVLTGRVPSFFLKQIAQVTAKAVPGTRQIHNDLDVVSPT